MHGAPFPCPPGKASLILVCAHSWEARPFIERAGLRSYSAANLPFVTYHGEWEGARLHLLLTGTGQTRAAMAVTAWLTEELREMAAGPALLAPAVVVANFGTAGAYPKTHPIGRTLLVHRVRDGLGEAHYPERLVPWEGEEEECRTVAAPQVEVLEGDRERGRTPVFDMEAFGIAEATTAYLSSSHLLIGKCVCDHVGQDVLEWKALARRCEQDYAMGAGRFLDHALAHARALSTDPRRQEGLAIAAAVESCLQAVRSVLPLTVTQTRELTQQLRAHMAACADDRQRQDRIERIKAGLGGLSGGGKSQSKAALARLLDDLAP